MGRSQVLFNRTKARLRSGRGTPGRGSPQPPGTKRSSSNTTTNNAAAVSPPEASWRQRQRSADEHDNGDGDEDQHERNKQRPSHQSVHDAAILSHYKEAQVDQLLNIQAGEAYAFPTDATIQKSANQTDFNLLSLNNEQPNGGLDLSAMAASLNQLPLSRRFQIPRHLAATLVVAGENDELSDDECSVGDENERASAAPSPVKDSVARKDPPAISCRASSMDESANGGSTLAPSPDKPDDEPIVQSSSTVSMLSMPDPSPMQAQQPAEGTLRSSLPKKNSPPDRRRHQILQRTPTSPRDLLLEHEDSYMDDPDDDASDDMVTRLRQRNASDADQVAVSLQDAEVAAQQQQHGMYDNNDAAMSITLAGDDTTTQATETQYATSIAAVAGATGLQDDMDDWLDTALESKETFESTGEGGNDDNIKEAEQLDDWLDSVIE